MQVIQHGNAPDEVLKRFINESKNASSYVKNLKEAKKLRYLVSIGKATHLEKVKLKRLEEELNSNKRYKLLTEKYYSNLVEDLEIGGDDKNVIRKKGSELLQTLPKFLRTGLELAYVNRNTELYKLLEDSVHLSDFIAILVLDSFLVDQGVDEVERFNILDDAFVNYAIPYDKVFEYLNRKGIVNFSKYTFRSQRAIKNIASDKPLYGLATLIAQGVVGDIDDVTDQLLFSRSWNNFGFDPVGMLSTVMTPALIRNL